MAAESAVCTLTERSETPSFLSLPDCRGLSVYDVVTPESEGNSTNLGLGVFLSRKKVSMKLHASSSSYLGVFVSTRQSACVLGREAKVRNGHLQKLSAGDGEPI